MILDNYCTHKENDDWIAAHPNVHFHFTPTKVIAEITDQLEESFVPFKVDIVTTPQLKGRFADCVKKEATLWM